MNSIQENCGVFGICSSAPCVEDIYQGIDFLQHRGQEYCGIATFDGQIRQVTHHGKVGNTFKDSELQFLAGAKGIGHVILKERQPVMWQSRLGEISVAFSGNIINANDLVEEMKGRGHAFYRSYNIEVIGKIIIEAGDIVSGVVDLSRKIVGAYSLVILSQEGVYAARDIYGFRPLILGKDANRYAVSSE